ncbi:MAG: TIGR02594 family protein [Saprospiraceae bacterium]|nr:TIGR02594 family protein [Saprospiraceae bacterium]
MEKILKVAAAELGIREFPGPDHNPKIIRYAHDVGLRWVDDDETPWCSIFMNWVAWKAGFKKSGKANARSWLDIGFEVLEPEPGDIAIFWRETPESALGHVGIFLGYALGNNRIYVLGGNQQNAVSVSAYDTARLLQFRRLVKEDIRLTTKVLQMGDRGPEVAALQDTLKMAGFNCGTSDGYFGPRTENAVKELQAYSIGLLAVDGVFGPATKAYLKELIEQQG